MELLIVIAVMTVILSISFYFFSGVGKNDALEKDVAGLTSFIRDARLLSVTSKNSSAFGIHLENNRAVLFEGNVYVAGGPNEKIIEFSKYIYMSAHALNTAGSDIVFERLTGSTSDFGTVTLSLTDDSTSSTITILRTGVIQ